jgi:hypothetical protein
VVYPSAKVGGFFYATEIPGDHVRWRQVMLLGKYYNY